MRSALIIAVFAFVTVLCEHILAEVTGGWFRPNLAVILVVFFNLFRGIRYSLCAALMTGLLQDSFTTQAFGVQMFVLTACAYLTTAVKMYTYHPGSRAARLLVVFLIAAASLVLSALFHALLSGVGLRETFSQVLVPELAATVVAANYVFERYKRCALRLFA